LKIPYDWIIAPGPRNTIKELKSPYTVDHIFVAYISYEDFIAKRAHTSWMGMHIYPHKADGEQIARAGGDTWNKWD
jgi:hypothetical protein